MANRFFTLLLFTTTVLISIHNSYGRYLRPSDHGLAYQNTSYSPKKDIPEMLSFFKGKRAASTSIVPNTPLPEARNLTSSRSNNDDPATMWWSRNPKSREGNDSRDHTRQILLLTSLLCGLTGIVLLVVSAFVFIYRYMNRDQQQMQPTEGQLRKKRPAVSTALVLAPSGEVKMKNTK